MGSSTTGRKLWLLTGGALAVVLAAGLLTILAPVLQREYLVALTVVSAIWAAFGLLVLLADAPRVQKLVVLIAFTLAVTLSFATHWFGIAAFLLGYFGLVLFIGTVLVFGILRLFRRRPGLRILLLPLTMVAIGSSGLLLSAYSSRPAPPIPLQAMGISDELSYIYNTDQSDRLTGYMWIDLERDRLRLQRVKSLYGAGQITKPMDQLHAAMIYQHAACADDYHVAYELASAAEASHAVRNAYPPLSHLAFDRWQLALGKRQTYGTQFPPVPMKRPCPPAQ